MNKIALLITFLSLHFFLTAQVKLDEAVQVALEKISADSIRSHIAYLAAQKRKTPQWKKGSLFLS